MTALGYLALWLLAGIPLALIVGALLRWSQPPVPECSGCRDLERQLAHAGEHIRLLERANTGLAVKVGDLLAQRRSEAS